MVIQALRVTYTSGRRNNYAILLYYDLIARLYLHDVTGAASRRCNTVGANYNAIDAFDTDKYSHSYPRKMLLARISG